MNKLLILLIIFFFSLNLRIWNLDKMGQGWDERLYVDQGYSLTEMLKKGDWDNPLFYKTYDHPPLVKYLYGIAAHFDKSNTGEFYYDYTYSRFLSAFISSLAVVVLVIFGWAYVSKFVGIISGVILAMLPFFLGFSQLVTTESFTMLFFTATFFSFISLLNKYSFKKLILTGILLGLSIQIKQSNVLLIPLMVTSYLIFSMSKGRKIDLNFKDLKAFSLILAISIFVFILIWPQLILHIPEVYSLHRYYWSVTTSPPEIFFGNLIMVPVPYYFVMFAITTPVIVLLFFLLGLKFIDKQKKWILYSVVAWFFIPFLQSFYPWRQHGVRYIIEIYAPLALISALGFEHLVGKFTKQEFKKYLYFVPVFVYLASIIFRTTPYYLDYFNMFVGGMRSVYERQTFQLGWWGQGVRDSSLFMISNLPKGSRVGFAISPPHSAPDMPMFDTGIYNRSQEYDYILVNYYNILREKFDDREIKIKYTPVYETIVDGVVLAKVYKRK